MRETFVEMFGEEVADGAVEMKVCSNWAYSVEGMLQTEGRGGTPYGASTIAGGQGALQPTPEDLAIARALGRRVAEVTARVPG